jgi:hypothetical protein
MKKNIFKCIKFLVLKTVLVSTQLVSLQLIFKIKTNDTTTR